MKRLLLVQSLAGGAVAQHMTLPLVHNAIVAAADPAASGSEACSAANRLAQNCARQDLAAMNPASVVKCACCDGGRDVAASYSMCSFMSKAAPTATSQYDAYGTLYSVCSASGSLCGGGGASTNAPSSTGAPSSRGDPLTPTPLTSSETIVTLGPPCISMVGLFQSCTKAIQGFVDLPFCQQGPCYCCVTARGQPSWTDQFDKYAQTCRDWAKASGPQTVYSLAQTFAGFCKKFSDACSPRTTLPSTPATATSTNVGATSTGGQTSRTTASTSAPTTTGAASSLRVGHAAALVAAAAVAVAL